MARKRPDGKLVKNVDPFMRIVPYIMFERNDSMNFIYEEVDCARMDAYLKTSEQARELDIGYMHIVMAAMIRTIYLRPELNRFIMNGRIYERDKVWMSFAVHRSLRGDLAETTVKIAFDGTESLFEIAKMINDAIAENAKIGDENDTDKLAKVIMSIPGFLVKGAVRFIMWMDRHNIMPKSIIHASPFHTSFFITNMKSLGIGTILHHLYNFGTTGQFISMGKERYLPVVDNKQHIVIKKMMELGVVTDERICDGLYYARSTKMMKRFVHQPQLLEEPIDPKK